MKALVKKISYFMELYSFLPRKCIVCLLFHTLLKDWHYITSNEIWVNFVNNSQTPGIYFIRHIFSKLFPKYRQYCCFLFFLILVHIIVKRMKTITKTINRFENYASGPNIVGKFNVDDFVVEKQYVNFFSNSFTEIVFWMCWWL